MNQSLLRRITLTVLFLFAVALCAARVPATEIPGGTTMSTITISDDSELTGDITCMVAGAPCIAFGASGIKLRLNGFTITDGANASTTCATSNFSEDGIVVNAQHDVAILGPGLVQKFAGLGIALLSSSKVKVKGVTVSDSCFSGIFMFATTDSDIERNVSVRNSVGSQGNACGGT
jgi:hypothetical protein